MINKFLLSRSPSLNVVFGLWLLVVLGCVGANTGSHDPSTPKKSIEETEEFKQLSATQHLNEAKKRLSNQPAEYDRYVAALHLKAIPESAPEYSEAQKLLKNVGET